MSEESFRNRRYFPALDGLRCFSIAAVIWHHSTPRPLDGLAGRGHIGVRLFFCISGLLITTLLLREKRASGTVSLPRFWTRRVLRIFPLYYTVLALFTLFAFTLPPGSPMRMHFMANLPFYASHTSNWFVNFGVEHKVLFAFAWSLATEEQFYLCLPVLIWLVPRQWALGLVLALAIIVDQLAEHRMLSLLLQPHGRAEIIVTSFMASIGFGALFAVLLDGSRSSKWLLALLDQPISAPLLLVLVGYWLVVPPQDFVWFEAALAALVAACAVGQDRWLPRLLSHRALCYVGQVSYGMYLFHVPVIGAVRAVLPSIAGNASLVFPLAIALTTAVASLSHRHFESWFLALRGRMTAKQGAVREHGQQGFSGLDATRITAAAEGRVALQADAISFRRELPRGLRRIWHHAPHG